MMAPLLLLSILLGVFVDARVVHFANKCTFPVGVATSFTTITSSDIPSGGSWSWTIPSNGGTYAFHRANPCYAASACASGFPSATLAEFAFADQSKGPVDFNWDWVDISIIPPGCSNAGSYNDCVNQAGGKDGYDVPMQIVGNNGAFTITCLSKPCSEAYQYPSDNTKSKTSGTGNIGNDWTVTFCPNGGTAGVDSDVLALNNSPAPKPAPAPPTPAPATISWATSGNWKTSSSCDFAGQGDFKSVGASAASACPGICDSNSPCTFYAFAGGVCYLKQGTVPAAAYKSGTACGYRTASTPTTWTVSYNKPTIPKTGSFTVSVAYSAVQSGAIITIDVLDNTNWSKWGTGSVTVNAGTGTVNIVVSLYGGMTCSNKVLNAWVVTAADSTKSEPWTLAKVTLTSPPVSCTSSAATGTEISETSGDASENNSDAVPAWAAGALALGGLMVVGLLVTLTILILKKDPVERP